MVQFYAIAIASHLVLALAQPPEGGDAKSCIDTSCSAFDEVSVLQTYSMMRPGAERDPRIGSYQLEGDLALQQLLAEQGTRPSALGHEERAVIAASGGDARTAQEMENTLREVERAQLLEQSAAMANAQKMQAPVQRPSAAIQEPARMQPAGQFDPEATMAKLEALIQEEKTTVAFQSENIQHIQEMAPMLQQLSDMPQKDTKLLPGVFQAATTTLAAGIAIAPAATTTLPLEDVWTVDKSVLMALEFIPILGAFGIPRMFMGCWVTGMLQALTSFLSGGIVGSVWGLVDFIILANNSLKREAYIHNFGMHANFLPGQDLESAHTLAWWGIGIWTVYYCCLAAGYVKFFKEYY